jgi:DNA polymerase/3'-5' exonuclease PolX
MDQKNQIIESLDILRKRDVAAKQPFKAKAYEKVIRQLRDYKGTICTIDDLAGVAGIGEKIHAKIVEILETGVLASAERVRASGSLDALDIFQGIYGVGPAKASALVGAGIKTIADLRAAVLVDPKLLNDNQKIGLAYYEDLLERIPRSEMEQHETILQNMNSVFTLEIVGSYRRGAASSGDIDVLLRVPPSMSQTDAQKHFAAYIERLQSTLYIDEILAQGPKKCMAISSIDKARRLDLLLTPADEYAYALLYFTGSDKFNVAFRSHALSRGYTLNEHTMMGVESGCTVPAETEADIFAALGLRYIAPTERVDEAQIIVLRKKPTVVLA